MFGVRAVTEICRCSNIFFGLPVVATPTPLLPQLRPSDLTQLACIHFFSVRAVTEKDIDTEYLLLSLHPYTPPFDLTQLGSSLYTPV